MALSFLTECAAFSRSLLLAHPGHGHISADSPAHYIVEPTHAVWIVAAMGCGILAALVVKKANTLKHSRLMMKSSQQSPARIRRS